MSWKLSTLALLPLAAMTAVLVAGPAQRAQAAATAATTVTDDAAAIAKQKICPVTDQPLGSMGPPVKVVVKGRTVFLCCAGCKKKLLADPDKYLKKLDAKK